MASDSERLETARGLIRQGQYSTARRILKRIDDPTAFNLAYQLDRLAPPQVRLWHKIMIAVASLLFAVGLYTAVSTVKINNAFDGAIESIRLFRYCTTVKISLGMDFEDCGDWYPETYEIYRDKVNACHEQSPELDTPFQDCLADENIVPPGVVVR